MSDMKDFFAQYAANSDVATEPNWTVEQLCDAIVAADVAWPEKMGNDQAWHLWTARLRHDIGVKSVKWDEITGDGPPKIEVAISLAGKREWKMRLDRTRFLEEPFGRLCMKIETTLREWNATDLAEREERLKQQAVEWEERAPDLMDHLIGFRQWNLDGSHIRPIGMGDDVWRGGKEVKANCTQGVAHVAPANDCECGLYAWTSFSEVRAGAHDGQVCGAVQAWGRVEVHNKGFRSEYMRPVLLAYDDSDDRLGPNGIERGPDYVRVSKIAKNLGGDIEVVGFNAIEMRARDYGMLLTKESAPQLYPTE